MATRVRKRVSDTRRRIAPEASGLSAWIVVVALVLCLPISFNQTLAEWWLWESPNDNTEFLDQSQPIITSRNSMQNGHGVGQSFVPQESVLYRMDFMAKHGTDVRPFNVKLWVWIDGNGDGVTDNNEYAATVAQPPIWEDRLALPGVDQRALVTFYPDLVVTPGIPYYVEFSNDTQDGEFHIQSAWESTDPYPAGRLRVNGNFIYIPAATYYGDLYFRTYAGPQGIPPPVYCGDTTDEAPCFSTPGPWEAPAPPGPPITAADYRGIVESKADAIRNWALTGNGKFSSNYAMYEAFLYRVTSDQSKVDNVVAMFEKATEWREAHLGETVLFGWMEHPGWAYEWVRDSPNVTADDHEMIKTLLLHSAARFWPNRELGNFNHALGGALTFELITHLIPASEFPALSGCEPGPPPACDGLFQEGEQLDEQDHAAWKSHADGVWNGVMTDLDLFTDGSRYQYFDLQYLLQIALRRDEMDVLWNDPRFRSLVERLYEFHLPMGPFPIFGDTRGWSMAWGSPAWVFEEAAARWDEPKYKWMAWRIFDHRRSHLKDQRSTGGPVELWEAVYDEYPAFCHAYFAVDPTMPDDRPPEQAERLEAAQDLWESFDWPAPAAGLGQTFVASSSPLVRIDVKVRNRGEVTPGTVRLWKWNNSYSATVSGQPLYADTIDLFGPDVFMERTLYPFLELEVGATYYVEFARQEHFLMKGTLANDPYADGELWSEGSVDPQADLWFRTYTLTDDGSKVTERREVFLRRYSQWGSPRQYWDFGTQLVPDKLILRSGYGIDDLHAVVNLVAGEYAHSHMETGAVVSLAHEGSVLLADTTYYDGSARYQNRFMTRRYWGGAPAEAIDSVTVSRLADSREVTVAWVDWGNVWGWDVHHRRKFFFVKNRFLLVRDAATFESSMMAATGNVWHAYDVHPEHGTNWYELYDREPQGMFGWVFKNPEQYLLVYMVDRPGIDFAEWEVAPTETPPSPPFIVSQKYSTSTAPGETLWLDSVLLPHGPDLSPSDAASNVEVVYDDGTNIALSIAVDDEIWTLVDNPGEVTVDTGDLITDASYLVTRTSSDGSHYVLTLDASLVEVHDGPGRLIRLDWPVRTSVEIQDVSMFQDTDGDGMVDATDDDDDNDGVADGEDLDPIDAFVCGDSDGDTCDDCVSGTFDPTADDSDLDGVCGPQDNCPLDANASQQDADEDGIGDVCDNCPELSSPVQDDFDEDLVGDPCDNCVFYSNPGQSDMDDDLEGDRCDLDDGMIYITINSADLVEWQEEVGFTKWNSYRGDLGVLRAAGTYTQNPLLVPLARRECGLRDPFTTDADPLLPGQVAFYLTTGVFGSNESDLGMSSSGTRPNLNPCP